MPHPLHRLTRRTRCRAHRPPPRSKRQLPPLTQSSSARIQNRGRRLLLVRPLIWLFAEPQLASRTPSRQVSRFCSLDSSSFLSHQWSSEQRHLSNWRRHVIARFDYGSLIAMAIINDRRVVTNNRPCTFPRSSNVIETEIIPPSGPILPPQPRSHQCW